MCACVTASLWLIVAACAAHSATGAVGSRCECKCASSVSYNVMHFDQGLNVDSSLLMDAVEALDLHSALLPMDIVAAAVAEEATRAHFRLW